MKYILILICLVSGFAHADQDEDFLAARDAFRAGDAARLDQYADEFRYSPLEPYLTYYQLRLRMYTPNPAGLKEFLSRPDDTPVVDMLRAYWLKWQAKQQHWEEFAAELPRLLTTDDEMACYKLQARLPKETDLVLHEAREFWFTGAGQPESCTVLFRQALQGGILSEEDVWKRFRMALEANNIPLAKQLLEFLPKDSSIKAGLLDTAASHPERFLKKLKLAKSTQAERMVVLYALLRLAKQLPQLAYTHWKKYEDHFDFDEQHYFYGWLGYEAARNHDDRALAWYRMARDASLTDRQLAWRTRAALRAGNWHEVWSSIDQMSASQQREGVWRYWKARAWKVLGKESEAEEILGELSHEHNFYGLLAADELGVTNSDGSLAVNFEPSLMDLEAMQAQPAMQRTIALYRMGLREEAAKEWSWAVRKLDDKQLLVASVIASRNEMYDRSINAADRTVLLHDFNLRYPAPFRDSLQERIQENNLEEAWVYGLMRQESRFVTQAKSNVGAAGLMQVMPATARWIARKLGMKDYHKLLLNQLDTNLRLGTYYMKDVLTSLGNNPVLASAAYNAGPGRAKQWIGDKPLEGAIYVETIPFEETRDYVKKVMSNTAYYAMLFGSATPTLKQRLGIIGSIRKTAMKSAMVNER